MLQQLFLGGVEVQVPLNLWIRGLDVARPLMLPLLDLLVRVADFEFDFHLVLKHARLFLQLLLSLFETFWILLLDLVLEHLVDLWFPGWSDGFPVEWARPILNQEGLNALSAENMLIARKSARLNHGGKADLALHIFRVQQL